MTRRGNGTDRSRRARWALPVPAAVAAAALACAARPGVDPAAPAQSVRQSAGPGAVARSEIRALARLEPSSGLIAVGARPGVRVERVLVEEGQAVKAGDLLAVLEGH